MKLRLLFLLVVLVALTGCKSSVGAIPPPSTEKIKTITVKEVIKDTVFETKADSSYYKAYIECINGKPVLKKPVSNSGVNLKAPKVVLTDNKLEVDCFIEAQRLFHEWKEVYETINEKETITIPYAVQKPLTKWQGFQIWLGRIFIFLFLALIIAIILRLKKII